MQFNDIPGNANAERYFSGVGSPEGVVTASIGDGYVDTATNHLYKKVTGTATNTGWQDVSAAGGSFGGNYLSALSSARTTTTSSTFQTKVTLVTGALTGTFRIGWHAVADNSGSDGEFRLRNQTDAVTLGATQTVKLNAAEFENVDGFVEIVLAGVSKTIAIEWRDMAGGGTQGIQDARIEFWKIS